MGGGWGTPTTDPMDAGAYPCRMAKAEGYSMRWLQHVQYSSHLSQPAEGLPGGHGEPKLTEGHRSCARKARRKMWPNILRSGGGGGLAQGLSIRLFAFGGAYWPLATAHSDPLWARTCFGCVNGAPDLSCFGGGGGGVAKKTPRVNAINAE